MTLLPDVSKWAHRQHPMAEVPDAILKLCEEAGEVAAAWNKGEPDWRMADELADVIITCCTTAYLADIDMEAALHARWEEVRARP